MKHNIVDKDGFEINIVSNALNTSNNSKVISSDKCIYCNLSGKDIILNREYFDNIYDHFKFLDEKFPCISDEEYIIKKLLE